MGHPMGPLQLGESEPGEEVMALTIDLLLLYHHPLHGYPCSLLQTCLPISLSARNLRMRPEISQLICRSPLRDNLIIAYVPVYNRSIGLDTCLAIQETLYEGTHDSKYRPSILLGRMVDAGWMGKKSGKGFYEY